MKHGIKMGKRIFWIILYGWAILYHGLLWIHVFNNGTTIDLAIATMALGLLVIWGGMFGVIQSIIIKKVNPIKLTNLKFFLLMIFSMTGLALSAEVVSTSMTNTAYLWGLSPYDAYITASPNYIEVVTRHSVIVFIPQFLGVALLHHRYQFKAFAWFIIYGFIGYLNEWLAFGAAASWVSIPFWMIVYGWIIHLPTHSFIPEKERIQVKFYHYLFAVALPLALSIPWALFIIEWLHR